MSSTIKSKTTYSFQISYIPLKEGDQHAIKKQVSCLPICEKAISSSYWYGSTARYPFIEMCFDDIRYASVAWHLITQIIEKNGGTLRDCPL